MASPSVVPAAAASEKERSWQRADQRESDRLRLLLNEVSDQLSQALHFLPPLDVSSGQPLPIVVSHNRTRIHTHGRNLYARKHR